MRIYTFTRFCLRTENRARKTHVFGVGWGGACQRSFIIVFYAAEISGIVATLLVTTLQRSLVLLLRDMRCSDDGEKPKNAPQIFPGFQIIKSARHCGKITIFGHYVHADEHGFRSGGTFLHIHTCTYIYMHIDACTCMYMHVHAYTYTYTYTHMYAHTYLPTSVLFCWFLELRTYLPSYPTHPPTYLHTYMHTYMHVFHYIHAYLCIHQLQIK